ncbi:MAG: hypothetical protein JOZ43_04070, partial [Acidobacteriales bacterium]|nr:hypothetical protein [Terriglobales bacterium]
MSITYMRRLATALAFFLHICVFAQTQTAAPQLTLSLAGSQTTFHIAERIPILLSFTSAEPKRYELNMATYDRSGRMSYEQFFISPNSGWSDPLYSYFHSARGFISGGLTTMRPLTIEPTLIPLDLNEWVRFDKPGEYQINISSSRVSDLRARVASHIELRSNTISIHIIPADPAWQQNKLREIQSVLASAPEPNGIAPQPRRDAVADLRFLQSAAAIRLMTEHIRDDEPSLNFSCAFGLMGLPSKLYGLAATELRHRISDPSFPSSSLLITTLA